MIIASARPGDYVDRSALTPAVHGREACRTNHKLLNCLERKLHYWSTDSVVLVVNPIDCDVDVAAARAIDSEHGDSAFGWVVRINGFNSRRKISKVSQIAAIQR